MVVLETSRVCVLGKKYIVLDVGGERNERGKDGMFS
jgi:hypothetical protein